MTCSFVSILLLVLALFLLIAAVRADRRTRSWNLIYETVGKRYNGRVLRAHWLNRPTIRLNYGQTLATISTIRVNGHEFSQVKILWPDRKFYLEVASRRMERAIRYSGSRAFDDPTAAALGLKCKTNDPNLANQWLGSGVVWQIERLLKFHLPEEVFVAVYRGALIIRKQGYFRKIDALDQFVRFSLELFDQAMLTQTEGIEFVRPQEAQLIEDPVCQVCCQQIEDEIVFCIRCRTAHCRECWHYTGVCSTFACGETKYALPQVARPTDDTKESESPSVPDSNQQV